MTIGAIVDWVGLNVLVIPAIERQTGPSRTCPATWQCSHQSGKLSKSRKSQKPMARNDSLPQWKAAQIGLVWRNTRRKLSGNWASWVGHRSVRSPKRSLNDTTISESGRGAFVCGTELKVAHTLDQGDESEFTLADAGHITVWFHNFVAITHGQPDEEETPTNEQLSALNVRVIVQKGSLYADFAVFTAYARKTTRAHDFTAYLPQPDGSWLAKEIPGPTNYQAWLHCWREVPCGVFNVEGSARDASGPLPTGNREAGNSVANSLAPCLFGRRFEHFNRLKCRCGMLVLRGLQFS